MAIMRKMIFDSCNGGEKRLRIESGQILHCTAVSPPANLILQSWSTLFHHHLCHHHDRRNFHHPHHNHPRYQQLYIDIQSSKGIMTLSDYHCSTMNSNGRKVLCHLGGEGTYPNRLGCLCSLEEEGGVISTTTWGEIMPNYFL